MKQFRGIMPVGMDNKHCSPPLFGIVESEVICRQLEFMVRAI